VEKPPPSAREYPEGQTGTFNNTAHFPPSLHPGFHLHRVRGATGFELGVKEPLATTAPPTEHELHILREEVDPHRYIIGRC
jgi:hypothetical protein